MSGSRPVRAAVSRVPGQPFAIEDLELEEPRADEILVRIVATGVCRTDVNMRDAPARVPRPVVLGHEGAGVVESVGACVTRVKPGDHVVITYDACGRCAICSRGEPAYCESNESINFAGRRADGSVALRGPSGPVHSHFFGQSSFATHALCTERNAIVVPKEAPLSVLGPVGCGVQTGAGAVLNALGVPAGASFGVFGTGAVGLSAIMAAKVAGARTIAAVDRVAARLDAAREFGATHTFLADKAFTASKVRAATGTGLDFALDTTGNVAVIRIAVESLAYRGVCGLVSSARGADMVLNVLQLMIGGRTVRGIVQGDAVPAEFIPKLIALHAEGRLPFDRLVREYALDEINESVADMEAGRTVKPLLRP